MNDQSSTRERIVEAARGLFFAQGYASTGIAQILKAAEANSGSLYHFFPTKEDLLAAVLERYVELLEPMVLRPAYERVSDPVERIFAILDGYRRLMTATDFRLGCPIGNLALETSNSHPNIRALVQQNFEGWRRAVRELLDEAADRLPDDTDLDALAYFVLAAMEGGVMLARAYRDFAPFDAAVASLREHFERLLAAGTAWSAPQGT